MGIQNSRQRTSCLERQCGEIGIRTTNTVNLYVSWIRLGSRTRWGTDRVPVWWACRLANVHTNAICQGIRTLSHQQSVVETGGNTFLGASRETTFVICFVQKIIFLVYFFFKDFSWLVLSLLKIKHACTQDLPEGNFYPGILRHWFWTFSK